MEAKKVENKWGIDLDGIFLRAREQHDKKTPPGYVVMIQCAEVEAQRKIAETLIEIQHELKGILIVLNASHIRVTQAENELKSLKQQLGMN